MALSIDGATAEAHDDFRGEEGNFDETLGAADHAREAGIPLQVNTTVCRGTVDELPEVLELVDELSAVLWSVFFLVPVGRGALLEGIGPERAETVMECPHEVQNEASFGVKTTEAPHYRRVIAQRKRDSEEREATADGGFRRRVGIKAGEGFAFVSHTSELYPSGFLPVSVGNVREESVVLLYRNSSLFERLRDTDELKGKCGACEFRELCGWSQSRAYATTGDPLESDHLCDYVPEGYDGPLLWG
jgi:radical SAM protein with 4Fe4S-binding SPASM domain